MQTSTRACLNKKRLL